MPRALAAWAWVTTEHELKLAVLAEVVVGAALVGGLEPAGVVVAAPVEPVVLDDVAGEELQAARATAADIAIAIPSTPGRHFMCSLM